MDTPGAPLSPDAAALLAKYYHYADLVEHVRALPDVAASLGHPRIVAEHADLLAELDAQILTCLERLYALGLYPTTTTAVDVTVGGVPITLPQLCRESVTHVLPENGGPTDLEVSMETTLDHLDEHREHNGLDRLVDVQHNGAGFFTTYVRPYLGYAATFAAGAVCGVIGAHYFGGTSESANLVA